MEFDIYEIMSLPELTSQPQPYFNLDRTIDGSELLIRTIEPDVDDFALAYFEYQRVPLAMPVYDDVANWNDKYLILIDLNKIYFGISNEIITDLSTSQIQRLIDAIRAAA